MATFVLVHGGWHGAWAWSRVMERLRSEGHDVFAPTLTGLADRAHLLTREVDLSTHVGDVLGVFERERLDEVVLCGHSYGGVVVTAVADRMAERIRSLVYADAFVPRDGAALVDLVEEDRRELLLSGARAHGEGWMVPAPDALAWDLEDPADRLWVDSLTTPHPLAAFVEKVRLTGRWKDIARKIFIVGDRYQRPSFRRIATDLKKEDGWTIRHLDCGHEVMIECPAELVDILLDQV